MSQTQQEKTSVHSVEFYPSVEDYLYIATRIGGSVPAGTVAGYSYYIFLFLNTIAFPAFLWINDHFAAGLAVLAVNIASIIFVIPRVRSDGYRKYYQHLFGDRGSRIAKVLLNGDGVMYESEDGYAFWPWHRIESVEETEESIYFFFEGNGFAVRKSGFAYMEDANRFMEYSRQNVKLARPQLVA